MKNELARSDCLDTLLCDGGELGNNFSISTFPSVVGTGTSSVKVTVEFSLEDK